ncbi:GTP-binding protein [Candidatus Woesebacteria bacterium]|nr:GTP-binding protein [Candidatus Woesebacteria bacterium]
MEQIQRPPIVTVLGHVDHGKTSLLDAIRKTSVVSKEAGGITQSIGASSVATKSGKEITFIDTPGHAAFTKMRSRGANVADIAILVIAADDGVKPQTLEALKMIRESKVPLIVVATKIDLPSSNVEQIYGQLEKEGVYFEGRGGDTPLLQVSSKTGSGIDELLEMVLLMAEVHGVGANLRTGLEAVVIESTKDQRGPVATIIVRNGQIEVGENIFAENTPGRVRALINDKGVSIKEVNSGRAALIIGFEDIPPVGSRLIKEGQSLPKVSEKVFQKGDKLREDEIAIFVKANNVGILEALLASLPTKVIVFGSGVGDVNESDILNAKSSGTNIFAFESGVSGSVKKLAEAEGVRVEKFRIIYELIQRLEEILKEGQVETLGKAEILTSFPFNNKRVAGCKVTLGRINKTDNLTLFRKEKEISKIKALSLKKGKLDINEAKMGEEFGIIFEPQFDFQAGDVILSARK